MNSHRCGETIGGKTRSSDVIASRCLASDWLADGITYQCVATDSRKREPPLRPENSPCSPLSFLPSCSVRSISFHFPSRSPRNPSRCSHFLPHLLLQLLSSSASHPRYTTFALCFHFSSHDRISPDLFTSLYSSSSLLLPLLSSVAVFSFSFSLGRNTVAVYRGTLGFLIFRLIYDFPLSSSVKRCVYPNPQLFRLVSHSAPIRPIFLLFIRLATKRLRVLSLGDIHRIRNHLVANAMVLANVYLWSRLQFSLYRYSCCWPVVSFLIGRTMFLSRSECSVYLVSCFVNG